MPHKNRITNQCPDQQKIIDAQVSEARSNEKQSLDVAISDHFLEIEQRRSTGLYQVSHPQNEVSPFTMESTELSTIAKPAATLYRSSKDSSLRIREECGERIIVTGAFPPRHLQPGELVETIRDPENPERLVFLRSENGSATIVRSIERDGKIFVPPDPISRSFPLLSLPDGLMPCGKSFELMGEIASTISKFVTLRPDRWGVVAGFVMASWFQDCFEAAPYLWVVGPLGSGKTKLLRLLWALCRRGLIAGDLWSGSVYKLVDTWDPTLIIDEFEQGSSAANVELLRLLRTGSTPGVPTFRNGRPFSNYGLKIIASRQPLADAALLSRGLTISLLPTTGDTPPLDEETLQKIEQEFQRKLCMFRLQNHEAIKNFSNFPDTFNGLSPRMRQIARALASPLLGVESYTSEFLEVLEVYDNEARIDRSLEPEWLVAETLMAVIHDREKGGCYISEMVVGDVANEVNQKLKDRHEDLRLSAKKVGMVLKALGLCTTRLGRSGRGLMFTPALKRKIHEVAAQLGIDRRTLAMTMALRIDYGGARCRLCEEFSLTAGLFFTRKETFPYTDKM